MTLSEVARLDIGQKEKPGNSGFVDPQLEKDMRAIGWAPVGRGVPVSWRNGFGRPSRIEYRSLKASSFHPLYRHSKILKRQDIVFQ